MTTADNRNEPRAPIELRVDYKKMNTFFADYTKNISKGGTFIRTQAPMPVGTKFRFKLGIPGFAQPVELDGEVSWVHDGAGLGDLKGEPGMGIRFLFADEQARRTFEIGVEKIMIESLGEDIYRQLVGRPA